MFGNRRGDGERNDKWHFQALAPTLNTVFGTLEHLEVTSFEPVHIKNVGLVGHTFQ
jgi:hypothetical protein